MPNTRIEPQALALQFVGYSLEAAKETESGKVQNVVQRLLADDSSVLCTPIETGLWSRMTRFFRHLFYSKEVSKCEDLKENLICIQQALSQSRELSVAVTSDQYKGLRTFYKADARNALVAFTAELESAVAGSSQEAELQRIIQNIRRSLPKEVLPCQLSERMIFYELRELVHSLDGAKEVPPGVESRVKELRRQLRNSPVLLLDLEVAEVSLEKVRTLESFRQRQIKPEEIKQLFLDAEQAVTSFQRVVQKTRLSEKEKNEAVKAFVHELSACMQEVLDACVTSVETVCVDTLTAASDFASFDTAAKRVWASLNALGKALPDTTLSEFAGVREALVQRAKQACSTVATSFQSSHVVSDINQKVVFSYTALLDKVQKGTLSKDELLQTRQEIRGLIEVLRKPVEIAACLKRPLDESSKQHLGLLMQTNTDILQLLTSIDTAVGIQFKKIETAAEQKPVAVVPTPSVQVDREERRYTVEPVKPEPRASASKTDSFARNIIKGAGVSAAFACMGVVSGLSLPLASVVGIGALAACSMASGSEIGDRYVTLLSGVATMGLLAYVGSTLVSSSIVPLDVAEQAIHLAVNETVGAIVPNITETAVYHVVPGVISQFANETVPGMIAEQVNSTVTAVTQPVITAVVERVVGATAQNISQTVVVDAVQKIVPGVVNRTLDTVLPTVADAAIGQAVNLTVPAVAQKVAETATPDFVAFVFEKCAAANLSQEACATLASKTLSPALQEQLIQNLTPELLQNLTSGLTPVLLEQLKDKLGPALTTELITILPSAVQEQLSSLLLDQLSSGLLQELPQELIPALTNTLTPAFIEQYEKTLAPELMQQLVKRLTPELQQQLKDQLGPQIFERLVPLFTKVEHIQWANKVKGGLLIAAGTFGVAAAAPLAAPIAVVGGALGIAGGVAKLLGWA